MKGKIQVPKTREELDEDLMALKLKIALQEYQEDEMARVMAEGGDDAAAKERLARGEEEMIRRIDRRLRRKRILQFSRKTLPQIGKVAACLVLVFYVGLTVAVATVESARVELLQFILNIGERYTSFGFKETGEAVEVPSEWNGYYYPSYIPEGYTLAESFPDVVLYKNSRQEELVFSELGVNTSGVIDTENAAIDYMMIGGKTAMIVEKGIWTTIIWNIDNRCLLVEYMGERDETIKIAESVVMIRE